MHEIIRLHIEGMVNGPELLLTVKEPDGTLTTLPADEMEEYVKTRRPVVYRGMTLDELDKPFPAGAERTAEAREMGLWDEEIWANTSPEFVKYLDENWERLSKRVKPENK